MEKNFRLSYLTKVGFVGVDLEKAIDQLLSAAIVERLRLVELCLTHELPSAYRLTAWKLLTGVLPCHQESVEFVLKERQEHLDLLLKSLHTMRFTDQLYTSTSPNVPHSVLSMTYVLERKLCPVGVPKANRLFDMVYNVICLLSNNCLELYWLTRNVCDLIEIPTKQKAIVLQEGEQYLSKNESALCKSVLSDSLSIRRVVEFCTHSNFYSLFQPEVILKLWDKVLAGSLCITLFVTIECLRLVRRFDVGPIGDEQRLVDFVNQILPGDQSSLVDRAVDLWLHNGRQLESRASAAAPSQFLLRRKKSNNEPGAS